MLRLVMRTVSIIPGCSSCYWAMLTQHQGLFFFWRCPTSE